MITANTEIEIANKVVELFVDNTNVIYTEEDTDEIIEFVSDFIEKKNREQL